MEKGKNKVDPILNEEERWWLKALDDFDIISEQYRSLMQKMNEWLQQHQETNEQAEETQAALGGEESASVLLARAAELSDTI
ncbi:hypothetical protein PVAP13_4KG271500 [Panicum virgatum]|uniref:Uncharacterized protein n=1 Tax=Panicum virgatum TaxID=38727 RepID=A0A8T0TUB0_PANVG|nr:hypothetical protein PVAP13_4KG271500 [Panicum virgatum]